jgi:hypothetical protein
LSPSCLNCNAPLSSKFCPECGQKAAVHRITFKHFILHDLLHGVWHIERGMAFTLKEAIIRPGQAALDYIAGKRIRYYNVFYLCLIMVGLNALVVHHYGLAHVNGDKSWMDVVNFISDNLKFLILAIVPMMALNARLLLGRLRLNIAEHFILAGMCLLGILLMSFLAFAFSALAKSGISHNAFSIAAIILVWAACLFPLWNYANASRKVYAFGALLWRIAAFYLLLLIETLVFFAILVYFLTPDGNVVIG